MDATQLRIRIPSNNFTNQVHTLYHLIETKNMYIRAYFQTRLLENEDFIKDCYGDCWYILHYAVQMNNLDVVKILFSVDAFADYLEKADKNGNTPMTLAIDNKNSDMIIYLASKGVKITTEQVRFILQTNIW